MMPCHAGTFQVASQPPPIYCYAVRARIGNLAAAGWKKAQSVVVVVVDCRGAPMVVKVMSGRAPMCFSSELKSEYEGGVMVVLCRGEVWQNSWWKEN